MSQSSEWNSLIQATVEEVSTRWLTKAEFEEVITRLISERSSPLGGLQYLFEFDSPFSTFTVGRSVAGEPSSHVDELNDQRGGKCRARWWPRMTSTAFVFDQQKLTALYRAWWKPELRTPSAGLPDLKRDNVAVQKAERSIQRQLENKEYPAVLFCDLDNFGKVNKQMGQEVGDRVIKEFAAKAESAIEPHGVLLHNGGDELIVLCGRGGSLAAIKAAYGIFDAISQHDFRIQDLQVGVSIGIASTDSPVRNISFQALKIESDHALHEFAKKPVKGRARFEELSVSGTTTWSVSEEATLLKCLVMSTLRTAAPFPNAWLNSMSGVVAASIAAEGLNINKTAEAIARFLKWMGAEQGTVRMAAGNPPSYVSDAIDVQPVVSQVELAFAAAHGILRKLQNDSSVTKCVIHYAPDGSAGKLLVDGHLVWVTANEAALTERAELQAYPVSRSGETDAVSGARAVLVKIGHAPLEIPAALFSEIIVVDDRPTRGGSLPDFWQVTVARLVAHLTSNTGVQAVFVLGDHDYAKETIACLQNLQSWRQESEELAHRLSLTSAMVKIAAERLEGRVQYPKNYKELAALLASALDTPPEPMASPSVKLPQRPILDRPIALGDRHLTDTDGCRVETVEEAFPVILEILRKSAAPLIRDQAGQTLKELVDFKVHVRHPLERRVPDYFQDQSTQMEEYYERAFLDDTRFFGRALGHNGQLDRVLAYTANVIGDCEFEYATRRAILIVPPESSSQEDWTPLGLVSIRLIPRFVNQRCELSFSFTWRTVEALVGFPYSLYGSARFAERLTERIRSMLAVPVQPRITMGHVNYIAHSLHMFMDEFGQEIARRIVNDATR